MSVNGTYFGLFGAPGFHCSGHSAHLPATDAVIALKLSQLTTSSLTPECPRPRLYMLNFSRLHPCYSLIIEIHEPYQPRSQPLLVFR